MTDKQIIIDGVVVSGCCWCTQGVTGMICADWHISNDCSKNPNCCYKQLKRDEQRIVELNKTIQAKEQECERFSKGYAELTDIVAPYMDDFTGYNEELGGFDIVLCVKELMEQLDQLKSDNKHLNDLLNQALKDYENASQTLTEIKEIAEAESYLSPQSTRLLVHKILQKISEVEDE